MISGRSFLAKYGWIIFMLCLFRLFSSRRMVVDLVVIFLLLCSKMVNRIVYKLDLFRQSGNLVVDVEVHLSMMEHFFLEYILMAYRYKVIRKDI